MKATRVFIGCLIAILVCAGLASCGSKTQTVSGDSSATNGWQGSDNGSTQAGGNPAQAGNSSPSTEDPGKAGGNPVTQLLEGDSGAIGTYDEATRAYTIKCQRHVISLLVPEGWIIRNDTMSNMDTDNMGSVIMTDPDWTKAISLWTKSGTKDAKQTFNDYEDGVDDLSVGHYVIYGNNKYYTSEGYPNSDGVVFYYYEGAENPSFNWNVQVQDEDQNVAKEVLAFFKCD